MHELAVTEYVFNLVNKQVEANNVKKVEKIHLLIGDQCDYVPEIIEEYLQVMSEGTALEGVKVDAKIVATNLQDTNIMEVVQNAVVRILSSIVVRIL